ncbi:hypothetical protein Ahy_A07g033877 [Arachis hypogaea]|uniref:Uncharacterized protein n=1 Tax=Arachis hypogaea TaxID=3818 RepID=A0A445CAB4_ARAHY|nr:hypothetical protein Ahy_A07g033877 [Arachis hypogaea]
MQMNREDLMKMPSNRDSDMHFEEDILRVVRRDQNTDDVLAQMRANQRVVKIATMYLRFYIRQKLLNVDILDLAHLVERVRQIEILRKDTERFKNEKRLKNKSFSRKEKVSYVEIKSSSEEFDFEFSEVDLVELKNGPPYFDDGEKDMKVDSDPFDVGANFAEPFLGINMFGFSYEFDTVLGNFEDNVRPVYPGVGEGLLEFQMQQKLKDRYVSLCSRCNVVFDVDAASIFEKEKMKKALAHKEEQIRQRQPPRRQEGQSSDVS